MDNTFTRDMLPCFGVKWIQFDNKMEAMRFVAWAENETKDDQWPCDAYAVKGHDGWEVKVSNW